MNKSKPSESNENAAATPVQGKPPAGYLPTTPVVSLRGIEPQETKLLLPTVTKRAK